MYQTPITTPLETKKIAFKIDVTDKWRMIMQDFTVRTPDLESNKKLYNFLQAKGVRLNNTNLKDAVLGDGIKYHRYVIRTRGNGRIDYKWSLTPFNDPIGTVVTVEEFINIVQPRRMER